ncbi:MAG: sporulation peptidase YabG [Peptococcaceae bacterium]|jgi:spore coat assembly protein|nr:sporulation peptidase YabG [Peptococcaceae bacterium]MDH7525198.1 sporulation peptidase YabG [Peptococcaceae bacterium]
MSNKIEVGDIVGRVSHGGDILFKVRSIEEEGGEKKALLRGLDVRLFADAPLDDLVKKTPAEISKMRQEYIKKNSEAMRRIFERRVEDKCRVFLRSETTTAGLMRSEEREHFELPGTVLHLDGDKEYLDLCKATYSQLNITVYGFNVEEEKQPQVVVEYLKEYRPDILVLTGHDGLLKNRPDFSSIDSYRNSRYFVEAVRKAREYEPGRDDLIIFAGACQSHYEALIAAGANFASSPQRVLIHAFDPIFIVEKLAYSSIYDTLTVQDIISNTITGLDGLGGIETRGCLRLGYPRSPY